MTALAPLAPEEAEHERRVVACIRAELEAAGGWLPFARYMELALYAPGLGYYAAGAHKLGAGGDFVTAPELSPVFARCLAVQVAAVLATLEGGDVVEIGAGSAALAAELLAELARLGRLPGRYLILETSPDLKARQRAALPAALASRVEWIERIPAAPLRGVVLGNEVLDALPVERFRIGADGVEALGVALVGGRFAWAARPAPAELATAVAALGLAAGYESEISLMLAPWLAAIVAPLAAGVVLFADYGCARAEYYAESRRGGTLRCFHRQRCHDDPFVNVGLQDLTASVDFTRVAEAAVAARLEVAGYTTQAHFLLATGFEGHVASLRAQLPPGREPLAARAAARLVLPTEMGERFKVIALARAYAAPLAGFALRDFTAAL